MKKEDLILNMSNNSQEMLFLETLLNMGLLNNNTVFYYQEGVKSVEAQKDHTLTMTIQLESSEIYFVVSATNLLDCYKKILKLLEIFFGISINITDISKFRSGSNNWKKGLSWVETAESLQRHLNCFIDEGQDLDKESKLSHVGHILCNAMYLAYMYLFRKDLDDRYKDPNFDDINNKVEEDERTSSRI